VEGFLRPLAEQRHAGDGVQRPLRSRFPPRLMPSVDMTFHVCAKKLRNGMGGNPHGFCQGVREPLGLSKTGRSVLVSSRPLNGTGELEANQQEARLG
jgi:hypothetical protein